MTLLTRLHNWLLRRHETNHANLTASTIHEIWLDGLEVGTPVAVVRLDGRNSWTVLDVATITRDAGDYWAVQTQNGERLFNKLTGANGSIASDRLVPRSVA